MGDAADLLREQTEHEDWLEDDQPREATCKTCGATGLYWSKVFDHKKQKEVPRLFDARTDERHACIVIKRRKT